MTDRERERHIAERHNVPVSDEHTYVRHVTLLDNDIKAVGTISVPIKRRLSDLDRKAIVDALASASVEDYKRRSLD